MRNLASPCRPRLVRTLCAAALGLATLATTGAARADEAARVDWSPEWHKFRPAEIALTSGLALQAAEATFLLPAPQRNWEGGILFDEAVRHSLRLHTRGARSAVDGISDYIYYGLGSYPIVVDVGLVAGGVHRSSEVAVQMLAMDLEAYAFSGAIALSAEKIGRVRPEARGCQGDPGYSKSCNDPKQENASFLSGHTTIAFTGAGLICAHHQHLPLYGGGAPDTAACIAALTAASSAGVMRVMSDNHYSTDVLLGMGVGLFAGYGLPTLLHYGTSTNASHAPARGTRLPSFSSPRTGISAVAAPAIGPGFAGLSVAGVF
jgi:hypothetical protein